MRVVGLDFAIDGTGMVFRAVDDERPVPVSSSLIAHSSCWVGVAPRPDESHTQRLIRATQEIAIRLCAGDRVFVEDFVVYPGVSVINVEMIGLVKVAVFSKTGHEVMKVAPTQIKKFVLGKGVGKKDEIRLGVYKRWGVEFKTNDEVDAYALSEIGLRVCFPEMTEGLIGPQRDVLQAIAVLNDPAAQAEKRSAKRKKRRKRENPLTD